MKTYQSNGPVGIYTMYLCDNIPSAVVRRLNEVSYITVPDEDDETLRNYLKERGYTFSVFIEHEKENRSRADIKQAAEWLQEGKIVRRNSEDADPTLRYKYDGDWWIAYDGDTEFQQGMITLSDILADDWEIVDG